MIRSKVNFVAFLIRLLLIMWVAAIALAVFAAVSPVDAKPCRKVNKVEYCAPYLNIAPARCWHLKYYIQAPKSNEFPFSWVCAGPSPYIGPVYDNGAQSKK